VSASILVVLQEQRPHPWRYGCRVDFEGAADNIASGQHIAIDEGPAKQAMCNIRASEVAIITSAPPFVQELVDW